MKLRKGTAHAQFFRVAGVDARDEGTDEAIKELVRKFSANKSGDGFIGVGWNAFAENVAKESPFRGAIDEPAQEECRRAQGHGLERAIDQDIAWRAGRSFEELVRHGKPRAPAPQLS